MTAHREPYAEYVGGDVVPADLWGKAPMRGHACLIVEQILGDDSSVPAHRVVDALIEARLIPDELQARQDCAAAFRAHREAMKWGLGKYRQAE